MSRCPNCMNELVQNRCSRCGYPAVEVAAVRNALPPETLLLDRYELGYGLASSHQSIAYIAYDCTRRQPVLVLEFFPKQNAVRKKNAVAAKKHNDLFMDACRRFLTSEQAMPMRLLHTFADNNTAYRVYQLAGNAANAVQEADELLDNPVLFRDAEGKPVMAVNSLPIPPLPHTTEWKLSSRLVSERTRKKVNRFAMGALAIIAAAVAGVVAFSMTRTWDVTVRVNTEDAIASAQLGDVVLPAATPGPEGYVEYTATLKRGEYAFSATSERDMQSQAAMLKVGDEKSLEVTIPTPTPVPVVVNADAGQWAYRLPGGDPMMVTDGHAEAITDKMEQGQLVAWSLNVQQGRAPQGVKAVLARDGYELPLDLSSGKAAVELTRGAYELILRDAAGTGMTSLPVDVADNAAMTLDAAPYEYYAAKLAGKPEPNSFYYISGGSTPLSGSDVADLSVWVEEKALKELFEEYRQYNVNFELAAGLPADVQVTINGYSWTKATVATFGKGQTVVETVLTCGDRMIGSEWITVDPTEEQHYTLGQKALDDLEVRWDGVNGLAKIGENCYISANGILTPVTDDVWAQLIADTQMFPAKAKYALCDVTLTVPALVAGSLADLNFGGVTLRSAEEADVVRSFGLQASPGTWTLTMLVRGETETLTQDVYVTADGRDYEITALNDDEADAIRYSKIMPAGIVQRLNGEGAVRYEYLFNGEEPDTEITAEQWLNYAKRYTMGGFAGDWTFYPVNVVLDSRVNPDKVTVTLDGRPAALVNENGQWRLDVVGVTGTEHTLVVTPDGGTRQEIPLSLGAEETRVTLLSKAADVWESALRFASVNGKVILLKGDPRFLTEAKIAEIQASQTAEIQTALTVTAHEDWQHMSFALRPTDAVAPKISLAPMTDGRVAFSATPGRYELYVLENAEAGYPEGVLMEIDVAEGTEIPLDDVLAKTGNTYVLARNEDVRIPIDKRINLGADTDCYVQIDFADVNSEQFLGEPMEGEDGWFVQTKEGKSLRNGDYEIDVTVTNRHDMTQSVLERTYILTLVDGTVALAVKADAADSSGEAAAVPALLSDIADEAQASVRWWGIEPDKLEQLPGGTNVWVLTTEAAQANVKLVYLKYPVGTLDVFAFTSKEWKFALVTEVGEETLKQPLPQGIYYGKVEERYQPMYLSVGGEYRLVVTVPGGATPVEFDLGGIELTTEDEQLTLNLLPGENETQMLTEGEKHEDGSPVVELILGYYGADYANFEGGGVAVTPTPAPAPVVTPEPAATPESTVTPEPTATPTLAPVNGCTHEGAVWDIEEATCTEAGSESVTCKDCGFNNSYSTAKKGHSYTSTVTKNPSCGVEGEKTFTCSGCGDSYTEPITALTHSYTSTVTTEASCTAAGVRTYTCSNCTHSYTEEIESSGHSYTFTVTTEATCNADGVKTYTCSVCGDSYTEAITDKPAHDYERTVIREPTCSMKGEILFECKNCPAEYREYPEIVDTAHKWVAQPEVKPTCAQSGYIPYVCYYCSDTKAEITEGPTNKHRDKNHDGYCDVCNTSVAN